MNETVAFAKLFQKLPPQTVTEVMNRLRRSAALTKAVTVVVDQQKVVDNIDDLSLADFKRFLRQPEIENIVALATERDANNAAFLRVALGSEVFSKENLNPTPLITGEDLIALGLKPSPVFKKILFDAETEQLEGDLTTKEGILEFVLDQARSAGYNV